MALHSQGCRAAPAPVWVSAKRRGAIQCHAVPNARTRPPPRAPPPPVRGPKDVHAKALRIVKSCEP
eukprot:6124717-Prymnesium_polylepis.2